MRVALDLDSGVVSLPFERALIDPLSVPLGDGPLEVRAMRGGAFAALKPNNATPAKLQFVAKKPGDFSGDNIVLGTTDISDEPGVDPALFPLYSCAEDWAAAALTELFTATQFDHIRLDGQFRWRNGSEPANVFHQSAFFRIAVRNTFFEVGAAGDFTQFFGSQKGQTLIPINAETVDVPFSPNFATVPYVDVQVLKPAGGDNIFATVRRDLIATDGFTVELSGSPVIAGHYLSWLAYL